MDIKLSIKQTIAYDYLLQNDVFEVLYGGAKGGGKSCFFCFYVILYAENIIKNCNITKQKYPPVIGFLGRVRDVDFTKTTLETWKKQIDPDIYEIHEQKKEMILFKKVRYHFGGLDDEENIRKFNSAEYGLICIDQAEEADRDGMATLRGTQGRSKINNIDLPKKILFTANPAECFLEQDFNPENNPELPYRASFRKFVQALPSDNEFINSKAYIESLKEAWKHRPEMIAAYVEGRWSVLRGGLYVFKREWLERATFVRKEEGAIRLSVTANDPAWTGKNCDDNVIYQCVNNYVARKRTAQKEDTIITAREMTIMGNEFKSNTYIIDSIGIGAGVFDNTKALNQREGIEVIAFNSARRDIENSKKQIEDYELGKIRKEELPSEKYYNKRSQMWMEGAETIANNVFVMPRDEKLWQELLAVKYEFRNGKMLIQDKSEIKDKIGRSTDDADAFLMMLYARKRAKPVIDVQVKKEEPQRKISLYK